MRVIVGVLLLAAALIPPPGGEMAAQTRQAAPAASAMLRDERGAPLPDDGGPNACERVALPPPTGFDTAQTSIPAPSPTGPDPAPFCLVAAVRQPENDGGEWYGRRLALHRYSAWSAAGAFPVEIYTGWRLRTGGADPEWVRDAHRATVWVLGTTFAVNTVTGVWNWWDSRKEPEGRGWRTAHVLVMVAADAAMFATARAGQARARGEGGEWHRELGLTTAGLTALGHVMMLGPFRRD